MFKATTPLTENLEKDAFMEWHVQPPVSMLPMQVRFSIWLQAEPIPLFDLQLRNIFLSNSGNPTVGQLGLLETKALANLFAHRAGVAGGANTGKRVFGGEVGGGGGVVGQQSMYKPPFKHAQAIPIDIHASVYHVKRRY